MDTSKTIKRHRSTVRTSRLIANLLLIAGYLLLLLGAVFAAIPELAVKLGLSEFLTIGEAATAQVESDLAETETNLAQSETVLPVWQVTADVFNWTSAFMVLGLSLLLLYAGYFLKLVSALVESQVVDLHGDN